MKIIAESSSTRTDWVLVDNDRIVEHAFTTGLNPYFQSRREISHSIRLELPETFFRHRWEHVHFYCAGCATVEKTKIIESSLVAQFKTPVTVKSDLLGAARGLLVNKSGLACILGTGSNSCLYDGKEIVKNVRSLGYILGDEGSNAYMGKIFIADLLKELAPKELMSSFYDKYQLSINTLMDQVYTNSLPNRSLAQYSFFLADNIDNEYVYNLVYNSLMAFFVRNISQYDYANHPIAFVGSTCVMYESILRQVAQNFGAEIAKIAKYSMPGLVEFHTTSKR